MRRIFIFAIIMAAVALTALGAGLMRGWFAPPRRNVIIFVADGLRSQVVTDATAPGLAAVRREGVDFAYSHSLYPTVTTPNASAIATGHLLGDTGDFSNMLYTGSAMAFPVASQLAALEDDANLTEVSGRFGGYYLNETTLLAAARAHGYATAAVGKVGPAAIQDLAALGGKGGVLVDDATGLTGAGGAALPGWLKAALKAAHLDAIAPDRGLNTDPGSSIMPGVRVANVDQQNWFVQVLTGVLLPRFKREHRPFVIVFWSRDPDGTQHNEGDSLNSLTPGINGPTSMAGIRNASDDLQKLRDALRAQGLEANTDVFVTADHGFSTTSKQSATSAAAKLAYPDVPAGFLPPGFLAIDLSKALGLPLYDPNGLDVALAEGFHPRHASAQLGSDIAHPLAIIGANGGTDDIWLTGSAADRAALARRIVGALTAEDYVAAVFVDDALGQIPGALPTSLIGLKGAALTPTPSIMVSFRSFTTGCDRPEVCGAEVADTELQQGQGIHGAFSRADTHNFMAAVGPDFKAGYRDPAPVSNADIAVTLAKVLRLPLPAHGVLTGRVIEEALAGGDAAPAVSRRVVRSVPAANGFVTQLDLSQAAGKTYYDAAGAPGRTLGLWP